jgi:hypothetical protein
MQRRILRTLSTALLLLLLVNLAYAQQEPPTEELKLEALKLGYVLNGNSMVRWGSIDLTSILHPMRPMPQFEPYVRQSGGPR